MRPYAFIFSDNPNNPYSYQKLSTPSQIENQGTVFKVEYPPELTRRGYFLGHKESFISAVSKKFPATATVFIKGDDGEWQKT